MAYVFPPDDFCLDLSRIPKVDDICFPGGFCLSYIWDAIGKMPTQADVSMDFFSQIGPAMAPLKPVFDIVDTVLAIFKCVQAIPDAITQLNPGKILECVPELAKMIDQLLKMIPFLSIPKMVIAILRNIAMLVRSIASEFEYIKSQIQRIIQLIDRAADLNDVKMDGFLVCAQQNLDQTVMSTAEALKGIGRIILLINIFIGIIGGQEIPCFGSLIEDNILKGLDYVIDLLLTLARLLDMMADAIPDPDLALTLALGKQRC